MKGYYELIVQLLHEHGFVLKRQGKGSHELWANGRTVVIVSRNCDSRHTANSILRDAGIPHKF